MLANSLRPAMLLSVSVLGLVMGNPAIAQTTPSVPAPVAGSNVTPPLPTTATVPSGTPESSQQDDSAGGQSSAGVTKPTAEAVATPLETGPGDNVIVVTGSRIARPEFSAPNPIQSFSAASLEQSGQTNITNFLLDTPALVGSLGNGSTSGSNGFFESAGLNLLSLRNLGSQRTLVLVNGRRHVAGYPGTAAVDINTIPNDLIDRIDILTGGTSAIYGADGVSGVVNFVLKRNFEGLRANFQSGMSQRRDAKNQFASVLLGKNFADGRGNLAIAYQFDLSARLNDKDRPLTGDPLRRYELLRVARPTDRPDDPNVYDRVLYNDIRWQDSSPDSAVDVNFDGVPDFTGSGGVYNRGIILGGSGGRTIGGSGTPTAGYFGDFEPYNQAHNVNLLGHFDFSDKIRLFVEGKFAHTNSYTISQPTFDFGTYLTPDNAYVLQRFGPEVAPDGAVIVGRDNLDFGIRGDRSKRNTWRGVVGFDGKINPHLRYEISYNYGKVNNRTTSQNDRYADRYYAALDAVINPANGQITCRINLPGQTIIDENNYNDVPVSFRPGDCQPLNILGKANQSGLDFVLATHTSKSSISQQVANAYVSGDFGQIFSLPGGPVGFALGAEYRKETSSQTPSDVLQRGLLLDSSQIAPGKGKFDVKEAFAELNVPLLKDLPFAHTLDLGAAIRYSDYSTIGKTTTWKIDGVWAPIRDLTFRGTYSKAVRAPNISELFDPVSGTFAFINDPCDASNVTSGSQFRPANCTTLLSGLGLTPAQIAAFSPSSDPQASTSRPGTTGGNPNLKQEEGRTWTLGAVFRPRFLPGFTASVDYYDIKLKGAISTASANQIFALCVDQPTLANAFCSSTSRASGSGFANGFFVGPQNVAQYTTKGADVQANYRVRLSPTLGLLDFKIVGGYLRDLTFIGSPGADPVQSAGDRGAPKYIGVFSTSWTHGPLTLNYRLAYQSKTRRFSREQLRANPDLSDPKFFYYRARYEQSAQAAFDISKLINVYGGVNNLWNSKPDVSSGGDYPYTARGRYFYAGIRVSLDKLSH